MKDLRGISMFGISLFLLLLTAEFSYPAEEGLSIPDIIGGQYRPRILVLKTDAKQPFTNQDQILQEIYDLFIFDLTFSGAFKVFPQTPQAAFVKRSDQEKDAFSVEDWRRLKMIDGEMADYVMKTELVPRGEGQFELDVWVHDILKGQLPVGRAYGRTQPFSNDNMRLAGHKATGEIIKTLTEGKVEPITQTRFCFVNYNTSKQTRELYLIDYDGWRGSLQQVTMFNSVTQFPDWSPDGTELTYVSYTKNWPDCYIQNLPKGTVDVLAKFKGTNNTPRWCPDGQNLVLSLSAMGNPEIYLIPRTGKKPKRLTNNTWKDLSPDVSMDGKQVAFVADRIGSPQIYVMNIDGSGIRRISYVNRKCESPFWSPVPIGNDFRIAFSGYFDSQQADIYTIRPDGTGLEMLTDGKFENLNPTWSPNGRYIAFSSNRGGKHDIYIASSDRTQRLPNGELFHRVTYLAGENLSPSWSPN